MITVSDLNKKFGKLEVLKSIQVDFNMGKSYALIGPNGSGKTTLIKCILGMVLPDSGVILVNGKSIANDWSYRNLIGYMPQIGRYPDQMKIGQIFDMIRDLRQDQPKIDEDLIKKYKEGKYKWSVRAVDPLKRNGEYMVPREWTLSYGDVLAPPEITSPEVQ